MYPLGTGNMLQVLHMGLHVCQLMGYSRSNDGLKLITDNSARTLVCTITVLCRAIPRIWLFCRRRMALKRFAVVPVRWSIRQGRVNCHNATWRRPGSDRQRRRGLFFSQTITLH